MSEKASSECAGEGHLVTFDSDRIKDYVFATGRLKEIRGGSMQVDNLTTKKEIQKLAPRGRVIYADGGAGLVSFDELPDAQAFQRKLERKYRTETISATLSTACVERSDDFQETMDRAAAALRRAKEDRREAHQFVDSPYIRFCESCRQFPAQTEYYDERYLCESCLTKRSVFDDDSRSDKRRRLADDQLGSRIVDRLDDDRWNEATFPADLEELGQTSRPENYLGFIYCDGNRMGQHLRQMACEEQYAELSEQVSESTRAAVISALCEHFPTPRDTEQTRNIAPFEILLIGGDDLILVTAADRAAEVALTFCDTFQKETARRGHELSMSGGVLLAHVGQPILSLEQRSRELVREAKHFVAEQRRAEATDQGMPELGAIDFLIVKTPTLNPLSQIRSSEYWNLNDRTRRTLRPYRLEQIAELINYIRLFKGSGQAEQFPRNKLNAIYQALFQTKDQATFETLVVKWRLSEDHRILLKNFADEFDLHELPWGYDAEKHEHFTALADMIELYDFIPSEPARGGNSGTDQT